MLNQNPFDFDGADPHTADLDHVVGAPGIPEISVGILMVFIAGPDPMTGDGVLRFLVLVPIAGAGGIGFHKQVADLALRYRLVLVIDDPGFEARNDFPAGAWAYGARSVRDHHVQRLGRAKGVEDLDS